MSKVGMNKLQRQTTLAKHFFFVCKCEKCENEPSFTDAFTCADSKCSGAVGKGKLVIHKLLIHISDGLCEQCKKERKVDDLQVQMRVAQDQYERAKSERAAGNFGSSLPLYEKAITVFQQVLHAQNVELMSYADEAMGACIGAL